MIKDLEDSYAHYYTTNVDNTGFGCGLWQKHGSWKVLICFWSQLWKSVEACYSLIDKQLAAIYAALLASEAISGPNPITVQFTYPTERWLQS